MATRTDSSVPHLPGTLIPHLRTIPVKNARQTDLTLVRKIAPDYYTWDQLTSRFPLVHLLQPDYYRIFRMDHPEGSVYQQNLHLEMGTLEVSHMVIQQFVDACDVLHIQRTDRIIRQFVMECRLGAFDFITSMIIRWNGPDSDHRFLLRKMAVLQTDNKGKPVLGIMTLQDITQMVSSSRPDNIDITFRPERSDLRAELMRRIRLTIPKRHQNITGRELEIIRCLCKGMSSKEIASALYISKATVDTHRQNLIHKWEVTNTAALLKRAIEVGCI